VSLFEVWSEDEHELSAAARIQVVIRDEAERRGLALDAAQVLSPLALKTPRHAVRDLELCHVVAAFGRYCTRPPALL
jgi:hypothetical protein